MIKIDVNSDHPHSVERTRHTSDVCAELMRVLVHATDQGRGLSSPADLSSVMGDVRDGAAYLAMMVRNAGVWLDGQHAAGRVGMDAPADSEMVDMHMAVTLVALMKLETAAGALREAASVVHSALAHVTGVEVGRG